MRIPLVNCSIIPVHNALGRWVVALLLLVWGGAASLYLIAWLLPPPAAIVHPVPSNLILDRHGNLLYEWIDPSGAQHRPISLDQMAPTCIQATLATEDAHFYQHPGVDPVAIARSVYRHFRYGEPLVGASTLTQQLVRLTRLTPKERYRRTLWRKLKEAWLAFRLERHLTKNQILTQYLNQAYYGNFAIGLEAAAHAYFGQPARTLDLAQCALLAGLPQAPAEWNPIAHPYEAKARQRVVLRRMRDEGFITPETYKQAEREPLAFVSTPFPIVAPHFVAMVQSLVEEKLGVDRVRAGGLIITTTLDIHLQRRAEEVVRRQLYRLNHDPGAPPGRRVTSAAVVVLRPTTGDVLALVGSPNYFDRPNAGAMNGALALRQPGSAIKPIVYATAFDPVRPHPWGPATLVLDDQTFFPEPDGGTYVPQNYDMRWHGILPARVALAASFNIPAVKALQHAGIDPFLALADRLGLGSLRQTPEYGLSLALGAGEVSLLGLTRAYAIFANGGHSLQARYILDVRSRDGRALWGSTSRKVGPLVLDPRVAYLITDILADRYARVPTFGLNSPLELDRPAAVKTGTTTDWRDAWTVGYTPDVVTGVWVGNWDDTPMEHLSGASAAAPIWHAVMTFAHRGVPRHIFRRPRGIKTIRLCAESGLPARRGCPLVKRDLAIKDVPYALAESKAVLDMARGQTRRPPWSSTTASRSATQKQGKPGMVSQPSEGLVSIRSPEPGATFALAAQLPSKEQSLALEVQAPHGSQVTILVDGAVVGQRNRAPYRVWWPLVVGEHRLRFRVTLPDGRHERRSLSFRVVASSPGQP